MKTGTNQSPAVSVIIPVFNEARTIEDLLHRVDSVEFDKEIIVVDDGSTDGTRQILHGIRERRSGGRAARTFTLLLQPHNRGKGHAVRTGIGRARGAVTVVQDGDLEYDARDLASVVLPVLDGAADAVFGSRWLSAPWHVRWSPHALGNRLLTVVSNRLTGFDLTDMETCYKAIRTDILKSLPLKEERFGFDPEVTAHLSRLEARVMEIPISYKARGYADGKKIGWRDGLDAFRVMARCYLDTHG